MDAARALNNVRTMIPGATACKSKTLAAKHLQCMLIGVKSGVAPSRPCSPNHCSTNGRHEIGPATAAWKSCLDSTAKLQTLQRRSRNTTTGACWSEWKVAHAVLKISAQKTFTAKQTF